MQYAKMQYIYIYVHTNKNKSSMLCVMHTFICMHKAFILTFDIKPTHLLFSNAKPN